MSDILHSQGGDTTPVGSNRVASGKAGTNVVNSTWTTIAAWLETVLGFLKITSNLSDLNDKAAARTNLEVYSKAEMNEALGDKAETSDVLTKTNTTTYEPSSQYNPATLGTVDEGGTRIAQVTAANISGDLASVSYCKASRTGVFINITGQVSFDSDGTQDDIIFQLPTSFPLFTVEWEFPCSNATTDEVNQLYTVIGTRNIALRNGNVSTVSLGSFNGNVPIL